ncbi:Transcription repressor [Heracleum sosnowskyi]|uniref:Transcription repressor n=1 Tax=Heracleum sosnowskyi TaxID=360622 RepID=A0AAD8IUR6_9APIA|nr:Transcription repressor [Heracleum sosnowskyi]
MATSKRFKLKLSLPTFQFCRTKVTPSIPKLPSESTTLFSPVNPKSLEISYPSFSDPPPTPARPLKIMPVSFNTKHCPSPSQKIYNSPVAYNSDDSFAWPNTPPPKGEKGKKQRANKMKKSKVSSVSSGESGWFSSDEDGKESLISSSENFDTSCDFGNVSFISKNGTSKKKKENDRNGGDNSPVKKSSTSSVFRRLMTSCAVNDESFAVVKNSQNPFEDFKSSMMEMIMEKQMYEAKDLEQLLQCFLSLNSRHHHGAIIQAFSEIWHLLFM